MTWGVDELWAGGVRGRRRAGASRLRAAGHVLGSVGCKGTTSSREPEALPVPTSTKSAAHSPPPPVETRHAGNTNCAEVPARVWRVWIRGAVQLVPKRAIHPSIIADDPEAQVLLPELRPGTKQ